MGVDPSAELGQTHLAVLRGERETSEARAAPGRLPAQLTSFVGRQEELRLLAGLLESARLVTVVGPGGVGKTRLVVEAMSRHRAHRRGRARLVSLAAVNTADGLVEAVLGTLSLAGSPPVGTPLERVVTLLAGGEGVLVLDNCEQISGAVAEFAGQLLQRQPDLAILATSREPLEVMGEALCRLGPLDLPPVDAGPDRASASAAVRLFLDRTARLRPGRVDHGAGRRHRAPTRRTAAGPGAGRGTTADHRWRCSAPRPSCTAAPERSNAPIKSSIEWRRSPASCTGRPGPPPSG
ncbi:AAA family ATPase [Nonomuraea typhae]|uniref:AAA family ATPase n=1 Tax=Nonomuraea typhae TaxID=2603600 RepID=A0ABW7YZE9_9ACTN